LVTTDALPSRAARYAQVNRRAWNYLASVGSSASEPWSMGSVVEQRAWVDEFGWLPWKDLHSVLLLCGAGGQQAPTFASLGLAVTVVDLSEEQLAIDRSVASERDLNLECIRANACDLSVLAGRTFDLVYQPVSTCYMPDPRLCYRNVAGLLRPGGLYLSDHWNPAQIQLSGDNRWDGSAYRIGSPSGTGEGLQVTHPSTESGPSCMYFAHRLADLVGGICDAGFVIERFAERGLSNPAAAPDTQEHLGAFIPPFYEVLARRVSPASKSKPALRNRNRPARGSNGSTPAPTSGSAGSKRVPVPLTGRPCDRPDLFDRWQRNGFIILRNVLDQEGLVPALQQETLTQQVLASASKSADYAIADHDAYVSGGMNFTSAPPGPMLHWLHKHRDLRDLIHAITGNDRLQANSNIAYMYYDGTSFIDLHTDVEECQVTVLTSVLGRTPPLVAYPKLRDVTARSLLGTAKRSAGRPSGGVALEVPVGGLLVIDGRRLPHRRPKVPKGEGPFGIAALCFAERPRAEG
jgi:SAM-dependent methyltransferase